MVLRLSLQTFAAMNVGAGPDPHPKPLSRRERALESPPLQGEGWVGMVLFRPSTVQKCLRRLTIFSIDRFLVRT